MTSNKRNIFNIKHGQLFLLLIYGTIPIYFIAILSKYKLFYIYIVFVFYILAIVSFYYWETLVYIIRKNILMIGLFCSFYLSSIWAIDRANTLYSSFLISIFLVLYFMFCFIVVKNKVKNIEGLYILILIFLFILNVIMLFNYGNIRAEATELKKFIISSGGSASSIETMEMGEIIGSYSNHMAAMVEVCIPFILNFFRFQKKKSLLHIILLVMILFNIFISQSRGGFLILGITILLIPFVYCKSILQFIKLVFYGCLIISILMLVLINIPTTNKLIIAIIYRVITMQNIFQKHKYEVIYEKNKREIMYIEGLHIIKENPILGIGYGNFKTYVDGIYGYGVSSHNIFFTLLTGSGILGLIIFISIILKALKNLWLNYKFFSINNTEYSWWFLANFIALLLLLTHGQFRPLLNNPIFYLPLAVGIMNSPVRENNHTLSNTQYANTDPM